jgi:hypothetical protein
MSIPLLTITRIINDPMVKGWFVSYKVGGSIPMPNTFINDKSLLGKIRLLDGIHVTTQSLQTSTPRQRHITATFPTTSCCHISMSTSIQCHMSCHVNIHTPSQHATSTSVRTCHHVTSASI